MTFAWPAVVIILLAGVAVGQTRPAATPVSVTPGPAATSVATLRAVTFNVRNSGAKDGPDGWAFRKSIFVNMVRKLDPDVLGLQEVLADQQDDLVAALADYDTVGVGRDDGKRGGEAASIFFRRTRFDRLDGGTFWLSPTPEKVASVGWDAALTRICTWVWLRDKTNGRELLAANTHFDHIGVVAREQSAKLIVAKLNQIAVGRPIVLTGDLNTVETTSAYAAFIKPADGAAALVDAYRVVHPNASPDEATYHGFKGGTRASRIDYVFVSADFKATAAGIDHDRSRDGRYPSDHYPLWCDLAWK